MGRPRLEFIGESDSQQSIRQCLTHPAPWRLAAYPEQSLLKCGIRRYLAECPTNSAELTWLNLLPKPGPCIWYIVLQPITVCFFNRAAVTWGINCFVSLANPWRRVIVPSSQVSSGSDAGAVQPSQRVCLNILRRHSRTGNLPTFWTLRQEDSSGSDSDGIDPRNFRRICKAS